MNTVFIFDEIYLLYTLLMEDFPFFKKFSNFFKKSLDEFEINLFIYIEGDFFSPTSDYFFLKEETKMLKKLLLLVLSLLVICATLASCGGDETADTGYENDIRTVYASYVTYTEEKGETPKSYEEWLEQIKGADGADGADGITPHIGKNGNWWIGETDTGVNAKPNSHKHFFGEYKALSLTSDRNCNDVLLYHACVECGQIEFKENTEDRHSMVLVNYDKSRHSLTCEYCGYHIVENHTFDAYGKCTKCDSKGGTNQGVYWKETELIFEMSEHSNFGELTAGTRRYYAGDSQGRVEMIDKLVAERNDNAVYESNVRIEYTYVPDNRNQYSWGSNVQRIFEQTKTYGPGSIDIYCNFAYDLTCSALKGCFANLRSTAYGYGNNFFRFNNYDYVGTKENNYFDSEAGEGYFYDYMKSISLSDDKLYCLGSNYCIDLVRAFLVVPVNIELMNAIEPNKLPTDKISIKDGQTNIDHFYDIVWSNNWTYNELAKYSNAVYVDSNANNTSSNATANFGDRLGFALAGSSSITSAGLLYTTSVNTIQKTPRADAPGKYDFVYPRTNPQLAEFATALTNLVKNNASGGISIINQAETGVATDLQGIRNEFAANRILFGGIVTVGSLEDAVYQEMRNGYGFGIAPVPLYRENSDDEYLTLVHNVARIVAIAGMTDKFEQCSKFLDYQSTNSAETLDTYYTENLSYAVDGVVGDDNVTMLTYIRNHVRDCFDKTMEDVIGQFNSTVDPKADARRWYEDIRSNGYQVTDMSVHYEELYETKQSDLGNVLNQWKQLP